MKYIDTKPQCYENMDGKNPCPKCSSSDAFHLYEDHGYCYSCSYTERWDANRYNMNNVEKKESNVQFIEGEIRPLTKRKIGEETCRKWGVTCGEDKYGKKIYLLNHYNKANELIGQKARRVGECPKDQRFPFTLGDVSNLYGKWLWNSGKKLIITESEIDALSVSHIQNNKYPVVSIPTGAQSAKSVLQKELNWIEKNFEEVILLFDQDEAGQDAAAQCAPLFTPGKCKVASLPTDVKDVNELLMKGRVSDIQSAIWNSSIYEPEGICSGQDLWKYYNQEIEFGESLPFPSLNEATYGARDGETWVWTAGTAGGKTLITREIAYHDMMVNNRKVGIISLEESPTQTLKRLGSIYHNRPIYLPNSKETNEERLAAFRDVIGNRDKLTLAIHEGKTDYDFIFRTMRHMILGEGCRTLIFDHITAMVAGKGNSLDAECHYVMEEINRLNIQTGVRVHLVSHVRKSVTGSTPAEEGGRVFLDDLYGSGAIKQRAHFALALEGNQQDDNFEERNKRTLRVLKDRNTGQATGFTCTLRYNQDTGRLYEAYNDAIFGDDSDTGEINY